MPTQQEPLYDAEETISSGEQLGDLRKIQIWVDDLRDHWWWNKWYSMVAKVEVGTSRKKFKSVGWFDATKNAGRIEMGYTHHDEMSVIHELAHVLAWARFGSHSHDPDFARVYLELVYLIRGSLAYQELQTAFIVWGIKYREEGAA